MRDFFTKRPQGSITLGLGNEGQTLKASRAYLAGLGTTGVLIGSFFLLLTVGSTLVAFRGVPGQASNGDLSRIELRQQREAAAAAAQPEPTALLAGSVLPATVVGQHHVAGPSGGVLGRQASGGQRTQAGQIHQGAGATGPDALGPGTPGAPVGEKAPSAPSPNPSPGSGTGIVEAPAVPGGTVDPPTVTPPGSGSNSGSGSDSGSGSGTGSGSDTGSGSGTGTGSVPGSDTGGTVGTVGDTVEDTTGSAGSAVGGISPAVGQTLTDTGAAVGGLLGNATTAVGTLAGG
ncbi:MAG: hypothetical protein QOD13_180 [Thermoleophilaceae bacterium]|nr:hypothetical protein [Thermoleophilaceae bacterium]